MDKDRSAQRAGTRVLLGAATLAFGMGAGVAGAVLSSSPGGPGGAAVQTVAGVTDLPDDAEAYGQATYAAWTAGDREALEEFGGTWIAHFLGSRPAEGEGPGATPSCETTGRSTWCSWPLTDDTVLALQVDNEFADRGRAEAVIGAEFRTGGGVGVWPERTQEEADHSQAGVDAGHSPWKAGTEAVVTFYAENVLGWADPEVTAEDTAAFTVTDPATGVSVYVALSQPAREGEGGIWTITAAGAGNPNAEDPRDTGGPPPTTTPPTTDSESESVTTPPAPAVEGQPRITG